MLWLEDEFFENVGSGARVKYGVVVASRFDQDAGFSPPETIFGFPSRLHHVAMTASGSARAAWASSDDPEFNQPTWHVVAARCDGAGWSTEGVHSSSDRIGSLEHAVNSNGDELLVWTSGPRLLASVAPEGEGWLLPPLELRPEDPEERNPSISPPRIALNDAGEWIVVYVEFADPHRLVVHHFAPGLDPLEPQEISDGFLPSSAVVSLDSSGAAMVVWGTDFAFSHFPVLMSRRFEPGIGWEQPIELYSDSEIYGEMVVDRDAAGNVHLVWPTLSYSKEVHYATHTALEGWNAIGSIADSGESDDLALDVAPSGIARVFSVRPLGGLTKLVETSSYSSGDGWSPVRRVPDSGEPVAEGGVDVATESSGLAIAVWTESLESEDPDGNPVLEQNVLAHVWQTPLVAVAATPNPAQAGEDVAFSADAHARTTGGRIERYEWDFEGDGIVDEVTDEFGTSVTHAYSVDGTYRATVRVVDDWDYEATAAVEVVVGSGGGGSPWLLLVSQSGGGTGAVRSVDGGIDCGDDCEEFYSDGTRVVLTPYPDPGSFFSHWEGVGDDPGDVNYGPEGCEIVMHANRKIIAWFE